MVQGIACSHPSPSPWHEQLACLGWGAETNHPSPGMAVMQAKLRNGDRHLEMSDKDLLWTPTPCHRPQSPCCAPSKLQGRFSTMPGATKLVPASRLKWREVVKGIDL